MQNDAVLRKEVPFYCYKKSYFSLIYSKKFGKITMAPMGKFFSFFKPS